MSRIERETGLEICTDDPRGLLEPQLLDRYRKGHSKFTFSIDYGLEAHILARIGTLCTNLKRTSAWPDNTNRGWRIGLREKEKFLRGGTRIEATIAVMKDMVQCPIVLEEEAVFALVVEEWALARQEREECSP